MSTAQRELSRKKVDMVGVGREEEEFSFLALFLFRILFSSPLLILRYPLLSKGLEQAFAGATRHVNNACSTNFTKESQTEGVGAGSFPCYVPVHYTGEGEQGHNIEKTENVPHQCGLGANPGVNAIDLLHDTRHLCTRLRTDGIKAVSRGFSGGKQVIKFANARNHGRVRLF